MGLHGWVFLGLIVFTFDVGSNKNKQCNWIYNEIRKFGPDCLNLKILKAWVGLLGI